MAMTPRGLRAHELPSLIQAANRVFRPDGGDMGASYPLLFDGTDTGRLRIIEHNGVWLSHAGFVLRRAWLDGVEARVACFGAVFTHEDWRNRGLATRVMEDAIREAKDGGAGLGIVSGAGSLYDRCGFLPHPAMARHRCDLDHTDSSDEDVEVRRASVADAEVLTAIHALKPVRFVRTPGDFRAWIHARTVGWKPGSIWMVCHRGKSVAYAAIEDAPRPGGSRDSVFHAWEAAGDSAMLFDGGARLARVLGAPLEFLSSAHDDGFAHEATRRGVPRAVHQPRFGVAIWDPHLAGRPVPFLGLEYV